MSLSPLPRSMPFTAKADLMVRRGEARDYSHACSLLAQRRKKPAALPRLDPVKTRLPYADN